MSQNRLTQAKSSFTKAISLNEEFFYYYLQRGKINERQNNNRAAQADYATSLKLLPTTGAQLGLGKFAERDGNVQVAKRYYAMAVQGGGADAEAAKAALMRLDPPTTSDTSLLVRQGLNRSGTRHLRWSETCSWVCRSLRMRLSVCRLSGKRFAPDNGMLLILAAA